MQHGLIPPAPTTRNPNAKYRKASCQGVGPSHTSPVPQSVGCNLGTAAVSVKRNIPFKTSQRKIFEIYSLKLEYWHNNELHEAAANASFRMFVIEV